ncbi:hypothetical protein M501DRAFT_1018472 [Patellaria atrata CBS 101060]|uniref:Inositolphosphotransferase Aur1/Ipt1 domain-containing protein n=1 Tax=Patellaria atrata CBS 101060 TaxID=1346257 RepID=A0A9P4VMV9_9PEZI|nr:hypothetical protein M501DRAFT_1018472 [Patellaria atrata CBS 101060]
MGVFKNIVEPGSIVLAFTVASLANRRNKRRITNYNDDIGSPPRKPAISLDNPNSSYVPDNSRFRGNITSRFLSFFPFLIEIWYWNLTYWVYQLARAYSAYLIRGNEAVLDRARYHALSILNFEQHVGLAIEKPVQDFIMSHYPGLMRILAYIYYAHITLGVCFIGYTYTYLPPALFKRIRRTIAMDNLIAFIIITFWRCMPPRLLPEEYGFIDILHNGQQSAWSNNRFQLTIAAMPSLHFGTSLFIGVCLFRFSPHKWIRCLALLWPASMILTILATANHFVLDAVVGAMIPLLGWRYNEFLLYLRPLEEWGFWLIRTEKPTNIQINSDGRSSSVRRKSEDLLL